MSPPLARPRLFALDRAAEVLDALDRRSFEVVDAPPADVALLALAGEIDDSAMDRVSRFRAGAGAPPVVVIVDGPLSPRVARRVAGGADGIVERSNPAALAPTLRAVIAGQAVYPLRLHRALERPPLSNREKQIMAMVVLGYSNAEIAKKLVVTESTVKNHLSSAFTKLGVRSRSAAASLILDPSTGLGLGVLQLSPPEQRAV